jgi:hypothetical protein
MKLRLIGPAALLLASSGCFATRNDVRILQEDILSLRSMQARADSARARQLTDISNTLNTNLVAIRDSVRDVGMRLTTFQGATRQELYSLGERLIQLGELMGASAQAMRTFRADLEERSRQINEQALRNVPSTPTVPGDTTKVAAPPPVTLTEGPNVLYQIARDQFDAEGNNAQGDSVYRLVVARHASDEAAPTAMYKLGLSLSRQKKMPEARKAMQDVVRLYPRSDESTLASDWLARNPS